MMGRDHGVPRRVCAIRQAERERQRRRRVEPGIERAQLLKAANHETRRDEQHETHRREQNPERAADVPHGCVLQRAAREDQFGSRSRA